MTNYREAVDFVEGAFLNAGVEREAATTTAEVLVTAQLWGVGSHGLIRVPQYLRRLVAGGTKGTAEMTVTEDLGALVVFDGHAGLGVFHLQRAAEVGLARAQKYGVSLVAVANSSHCGPLAYFAWPALRERYAVILLTNGPAVAPPPNGSVALMSTSPVCIGVPTGSQPILVDMSTTTVARGKIAEFAARGEPLPVGWALDASGNPTVDAKAALQGMLASLGGAKGGALALGFEALTGGLIGPNLSKDVPDIFDSKQDSNPQGISHLIVTVDATALSKGDSGLVRLAKLAQAVESAGARLPGGSKIDPLSVSDEFEIDIAPAVREQLDDWADRLHIARLT
jgi:(2R)-3-sulfolactate dehydrogenase (NADP+)